MKRLRCLDCQATRNLDGGWSRVGRGWRLLKAPRVAQHSCSPHLRTTNVVIEAAPLPPDALIRKQPDATLLAEVRRALHVTHPDRGAEIADELEWRLAQTITSRVLRDQLRARIEAIPGGAAALRALLDEGD